MHVSLSLLQQFFSTPLSLECILEACDRIGIEAQCELPTQTTGVVTAKVLTAVPHPNADSLKVATLFDGSQEHQIVCGAANCREGIIVPVALPGAKLYPSEGPAITIKKSKLRGVESFGMCCGADEIGFPHLQQSNRNLFEFPPNTPLGINAILLLADPILELSLTPNLSHCASLLGLAREIAFVVPHVQHILPPQLSLQELPHEHIPADPAHDLDNCPLFCSVTISNLDTQFSPEYIQQALQQCKQKPINLCVDITNYIMLMLGQPLHAYDASHVDVATLCAHTLTAPEELTLLNNQQISLPQGSLIIKDQSSLLGVAGVMGGASSSVQTSTTTIVLESAYFQPQKIRAAQTHLNIYSEASYRFTRGIDPQMTLPALYAAIHCLLRICPSARVSPIRVIGKPLNHQPPLHLHTKTVERILGLSLQPEEISQKLTSLGFQTTPHKHSVEVFVPTYRHDIHEEMDLVEEIFRIQQVTIPKPTKRLTTPPAYILKRSLASFLASAGLQQFFTCDLLDPKTAELDLFASPSLHLQGSQHTLALRHSLLPGLLASVATNMHRQAPGVHAFEIGATYQQTERRYKETESLAIILTGQASPSSWIPEPLPSFFSIKGWVETLLRYLSIHNYTSRQGSSPHFHPLQQLDIYIGKFCLGSLGTLHPRLCKHAHLRTPVFFAEFSIPMLLQFQKKKTPVYQPYSIYPSSFRDTTLTIDTKIPADLLRQKLLSFESKWLERVSIISVYQDKEGILSTKNISLRLVYQDHEKTLSNQEIDKEHERLISLLNGEINKLKGHN